MTAAVDMSDFIEPKSDQINADDLIRGPRTIRIAKVSANEGSPEQPISINFEGDEGKPYKPCKSMRRVMVQVWGADASQYVGRAMTLYRDPKVQFGGMQVGGIRISHMSGITEKKTMALTATRAKRAPFTVLPLENMPQPSATDDPASKWASAYIAKLAGFADLATLQAFAETKAPKLAELKTARPDLHQQVTEALAKRTADLTPAVSTFDDDLTDEQSDADVAVARFIERAKAAKDADELAALVKEAEPHKTFLSDALQIRLEIAFDNERQRLEADAEPELAK